MSGAAVARPVQVLDHPALICGYRFNANGIGQALELAADRAAVPDAPGDASGFHWWHFNAAHVGAEQWLRAHLEPDQVERCLDSIFKGRRSSRLEMIDDAPVAVLNDVEFDHDPADAIEIASMWLMVTPSHIISVRAQPLRSVNRLRLAVRNSVRFQSPLALAVHLLRDQGEVLQEVLRNVATQVDAVEDQVHAERITDQRKQLGRVRRDLLRLQRLLAPEPAALFRLLKRPPDGLLGADWSDLQEATEELALILREVAAQQERIKLLQEEIASALNERTDRTLFMLTAVTVVALPMNVIAGLFGMNVGGIPFGSDKTGFWIMLLLVLLASSAVGWTLFRGRKT